MSTPLVTTVELSEAELDTLRLALGAWLGVLSREGLTEPTTERRILTLANKLGCSYVIKPLPNSQFVPDPMYPMQINAPKGSKGV